MKTTYYREIETLYVIGILLVIFGHSHPSDWALFAGTGFDKAIRFVYTFHMPLFFFLAGFLFRNSGSLSKLGKVQWLKRKAEKMLVPYVVLSLAGMVPKYLAENGSLHGLSLKTAAVSLLVPRQCVWGHFWFLPTLLAVYVIFALFAAKPQRNKTSVLLVVCGGLYFVPLAPRTFAADICSHLIFFAAGMAAKEMGLIEHMTRHKQYCPVFIAGGLAGGLMLFQYLYENQTAMLACAFLLIGVCFCIAVLLKPTALAASVSRFSMTFYLYGWMFQAVLMFIGSRMHQHWAIISALMFVGGWLGPAGLIMIYRKTGFSHHLLDVLIGI